MTQVPEELPRSTLMGLMGGEIDSLEEGTVAMMAASEAATTVGAPP